MGIVNLTPDSFSGDGLGNDVQRAIAHARRQVEEGADILDIGAESSRPGAPPTSLDDELQRLLPVLRELSAWNLPVSVDTYKPPVMQAALEAGASMINDITGLADSRAMSVIAGSDCAICLMHMQGEPRTMQQNPVYSEVVPDIRSYLQERVRTCRQAGIDRERIILDPGFCFGKTLEHNLALLRHLGEASVDGLPVLAGLSRKSMLGVITGQPVEHRLAASLAAAVLAVQGGAKIIRVHDVAPTRDALAVLQAFGGNNKGH